MAIAQEVCPYPHPNPNPNSNPKPNPNDEMATAQEVCPDPLEGTPHYTDYLYTIP